MTAERTSRPARIVVFLIALVAMVFILLVGMVANATPTANLFLILFFLGWVPATVVVEWSVHQGTDSAPRWSAGVRIAFVPGSVIIAAAAIAVVVPLMTYPLVPPLVVAVLILGYLPSSALALFRVVRYDRDLT